MIDDDDCAAIGGMRIGRGKRSSRRKTAPLPLGPPKILHDVIRARNRAAVGGSRGMTDWAIARPTTTSYFLVCVNWPFGVHTNLLRLYYVSMLVVPYEKLGRCSVFRENLSLYEFINHFVLFPAVTATVLQTNLLFSIILNRIILQYVDSLLNNDCVNSGRCYVTAKQKQRNGVL
jgi:hypothetical protein